MEEIKNWGLMLLFVSAGCMIYYFLLPSGNVSKTAKTAVSAIILGVICLPVFSFGEKIGSFSFEEREMPETQSFDEMIISSAKKAVENIIDETLLQSGEYEYKTEVFIDKNEDGSINISKVNIIFTNRPENEKEIREELKEKLGIMPDIFTEKVYE